MDNDTVPSPEEISTWVASCASLACSIQFPVEKPGLGEFSDINKIRQYLTSGTLIYKPIFDLASRGVMVQRGLIDLDEVDTGWIIAESLKREKEWHPSYMSTFGRLFLFAPIATAVAYLFSEKESRDFKLDVEILPEYSELFLENSTPEDTVNVFNLLDDQQFQSHLRLLHFTPVLKETIDEILEREVNLLDFCKNQAESDILFEEIASNYNFAINYGFPAFLEALNEGLPFSSAIKHTFYVALSHYPDSALLRKYGRQHALKVRQLAKDIIEAGSVFTDKGNEEIQTLNEYYDANIGALLAHHVDDITTLVTFLGILSGLLPN